MKDAIKLLGFIATGIAIVQEVMGNNENPLENVGDIITVGALLTQTIDEEIK